LEVAPLRRAEPIKNSPDRERPGELIAGPGELAARGSEHLCDPDEPRAVLVDAERIADLES